MRAVFLGDIVGKSGREALKKHLPRIRQSLKPDLVIVNGENAAHRVGITPKITQEIFDLGVDGITGGDHSFDRVEIIPFMAKEPRLIRPLNMAANTPGKGVMSLKTPQGGYCMVVNLLGRVFMNPVDDPFAAMEEILRNVTLGRDVQAIIVDLHCEATSEIIAFARHFDGRVSAVLGTHTHVPTADAHVLSQGTALQSDVGMCGDYDSVIGTQADEPIYRFTHGRSNGRFEPAEGEGTVSGCCVDIDDTTGCAVRIQPIRLGPCLSEMLAGIVRFV